MRVLAIDQGTTGSRAFVFSESAQVVSHAYQEFRQYYPNPGWVEHDPAEILSSVRRVVDRAVGGRRGWSKIGAIGITNQRETCVLWDARTGRPVHRAIVWQCRRTSDFCARIRARGLAGIIRSRTGLVVDPYFSGTKVRWMMDHVPGLRRRIQNGEICFGTVDSWLLWNLTGGAGNAEHATDYTNASRTMMFNIRTRRWDPELLGALGISARLRLPRVLNSADRYGVTRGCRPIPDGIPITGICGDQQAALFGQGATKAGETKNTYGTGCFLMLHTGGRFVPSRNGLLTTLACDSRGGPAYALEGAVFIAGAAVQWLRDGLRVIADSSGTERIAKSVADSGGIVVIPAFTGLGAPYWRADARGAIFGLTRGTSRAHIVRATLESIAFQTSDVFDVMVRECRAAGAPIRIRELRVDGGATRNNFLMQFQSDLLGVPVARPKMAELTAWGAAKLAGIGAGIWNPRRFDAQQTRAFDIFRPNSNSAERQTRIDRWRSFVRRLL